MKKAFTLVELLLVMMILGTILGLILNTKLVNYRRVYMGYQKKATEDVTSAVNLVLYRYPSLKNFSGLVGTTDWATTITNANLTANEDCGVPGKSTPDSCIRAFFKSAIKGTPCNSAVECKIGVNFHTCQYSYAPLKNMPQAYATNVCGNDGKPADAAANGKLTYSVTDNTTWESPNIGMRMKNGEVIMFKAGPTSCDDTGDKHCFMIFVDMNGAKGPNIYGQDRYRFFVDSTNVIHDDSTDIAYVNPNGLSDEEQAIYDEMRNINTACTAAGSSMSNECKRFNICYNKYWVIPKSLVEKCHCTCNSAGGTTKCKANDPDNKCASDQELGIQ